MVLIGCISRSQGQKQVFKMQFSKILSKTTRPRAFICNIIQWSSTQIVKTMSLESKGPHKGAHQFYIELYKKIFFKNHHVKTHKVQNFDVKCSIYLHLVILFFDCSNCALRVKRGPIKGAHHFHVVILGNRKYLLVKNQQAVQP